MSVRLGAFATLDEEFPRFLAQYGVEDVILGPATYLWRRPTLGIGIWPA